MRACARTALALLCATLLLSGCSFLGGDPQPEPLVPEQRTLRVGVGSAIDTAPLRIAVADGRFQRAGLQIELVEQTNDTDALTKLAEGELDVAFASNVALFKTAADGNPLRLQGEAYTAGRNTMALVTLPESALQAPNDLRFPEIAVDTLDDLGTLTTRSALSGAGVDPERITFVRREPGTMVDAIRSGDVDAAWMTEPHITRAEKDFGARMVLDTARGATLGFPVSSYAATVSFAESRPRTLTLFRQVLGEAQQHGGDPMVIRKALPGLADVDETTAALVSLGDYPTSISAVRLQRVADLMHNSGLIGARLDVQSLLPTPGLG
ncbi:NitT/TauT family transport system substrate-binding protein [Amycolatopsis marina]|uniref:NitT/TauT family transport system substrate-binding protein n=1 Tax=Amycolatopsis marina TaxID=490629 RepID=A0A1I1CCH7_9PSEU|nr:ABC transporter substrate-binding protein [Amycolatopsis marina]SFB60087.1 NitT/TauT family transport system substrate-binding protein [Amycolatopsis marina]